MYTSEFFSYCRHHHSTAHACTRSVLLPDASTASTISQGHTHISIRDRGMSNLKVMSFSRSVGHFPPLPFSSSTTITSTERVATDSFYAPARKPWSVEVPTCSIFVAMKGPWIPAVHDDDHHISTLPVLSQCRHNHPDVLTLSLIDCRRLREPVMLQPRPTQESRSVSRKTATEVVQLSERRMRLIKFSRAHTGKQACSMRTHAFRLTCGAFSLIEWQPEQDSPLLPS